MTEPTGDIGDPTNRRGHMPVEAWGLVIAGRLAALAGMVDAIGYLHLSGLFVSFMSGNSTHLAVSLGQGNLAEAGAISKLVALFVLGAAAGQVLAGFTGEWHMSWVLAGVTVLLTMAAFLATAPEPGIRHGRFERVDAPRWKYSSQPHFCHWNAGRVRPGDR